MLAPRLPLPITHNQSPTTRRLPPVAPDSASRLLARCAAAAGSFNACESPAERLPSAVSFSS